MPELVGVPAALRGPETPDSPVVPQLREAGGEEMKSSKRTNKHQHVLTASIKVKGLYSSELWFYCEYKHCMMTTGILH